MQPTQRSEGAALPLDMSNINQTIPDTRLVGIGVAWAPLGGCTRAGLLHHFVDLLERQALCLGDEEIGVHKGAGAEAAPDEEDGGSQVGFVGVDHVGGDDSDDLTFISKSSKMFGGRLEHTVFHSQLDAVERPTPRERMGSGNTSPMRICLISLAAV